MYQTIYHPEELLRAREERDLTQADVVRRSGVRQSTVSAYENGTMVPTTPNIVKIALAMGTDPGSLLNRIYQIVEAAGEAEVA